jgi:hypothetical protein
MSELAILVVLQQPHTSLSPLNSCRKLFLGGRLYCDSLDGLADGFIGFRSSQRFYELCSGIHHVGERVFENIVRWLSLLLSSECAMVVRRSLNWTVAEGRNPSRMNSDGQENERSWFTFHASAQLAYVDSEVLVQLLREGRIRSP